MRCWTNYLWWLVVAVLGTGSLLSACGQKGPLHLPEHQPEQPAESADSR
ncbi:MAG: lipoprotein [Pseudomonadota bacterium]